MTVATTGSVAAAAAAAAAPSAHSTPAAATKTLLLIRHGEGWHNVGYDYNLDAHLTPRGWAQTAALQQDLLRLQDKLNIQLVVVSPLRRTMETAAGVFGGRSPPAAVAAAAAASSAADGDAAAAAAWLLMHQQQHRPNEVSPQAALWLPPAAAAAAAASRPPGSSPSSPAAAAPTPAAGPEGPEGAQVPFVGDAAHHPLKLLAHAGCRERIGPNVCDQYRPIDLQAAAFPGVDFSLLPAADAADRAWAALHDAAQSDGCYNCGESEAACEQRALDFYAWLMDRPESVIAVVSHCGFLVHGMRAISRGMCAALGQTQSSSSLRADAGAGAAAAAAAAASLAAAAVDVGGRFSTDWANCECRIVEMRLGSTSELLLPPAPNPEQPTTAAGNAAGGGVEEEDQSKQGGRFLYARASGDLLTAWPGGLWGLN